MFIFALALLALMMAAPAPSQENAQPPRRSMRQITSIDGKDLYLEYCAQCHGREAKGDGPRAKELSKSVPDLTKIALRAGGRFQRSKIERFVAGEDRPGRMTVDPKTGKTVMVTSEGTDPMPLWQFFFRKMWPDQPPQVRIGNIVRYLEKIQVKE